MWEVPAREPVSMKHRVDLLVLYGSLLHFRPYEGEKLCVWNLLLSSSKPKLGPIPSLFHVLISTGNLLVWSKHTLAMLSCKRIGHQPERLQPLRFTRIQLQFSPQGITFPRLLCQNLKDYSLKNSCLYKLQSDRSRIPLNLVFSQILRSCDRASWQGSL
jgi:hypothetical protein